MASKSFDMVFTVQINTGNDACGSLRDIAGLLSKLAKKIEDNPNKPDGGKIMDLNGQSVGEWDYSYDGFPGARIKR